MVSTVKERDFRFLLVFQQMHNLVHGLVVVPAATFGTVEKQHGALDLRDNVGEVLEFGLSFHGDAALGKDARGEVAFEEFHVRFALHGQERALQSDAVVMIETFQKKRKRGPLQSLHQRRDVDTTRIKNDPREVVLKLVEHVKGH